MIYLILAALLAIFYFDLKERQVYILLFLFIIGLGGFLFYRNTTIELYSISIATNIICLLLIGIVLWGYSKFKMKISLYDGIGIGDFLFFLFMAVSFPTNVFLVLFSFSLIFSLILFMILKPKLKHKTVPLAGLQALFLFILLFINLIFDLLNLYAI